MTSAHDLLSDLTKQELRRIASSFALKTEQAKQMTSAGLIDWLTGCYENETVLSVVERLPKNDRQLLVSLVLFARSNSEGISERDMQATFRKVAAGKGGVKRLIEAGVVFRRQSGWQSVLVVPNEVSVTLNDTFARRMAAEAMKKVPEGDVQSATHFGLAAVHDFMHFLAIIAGEDVAVTQQGRLYKRMMRRMSADFRLSDDLFPPVYGDFEAVTFWSDFASYYRLASFTSGICKLNHQRLHELLSCSYVQWLLSFVQFYRFYARILIRYFPLHLLESMLSLCGRDGKWCAKKQCIQAVETWEKAWGVKVDMRLLDLCLLYPLTLFGCIETAVGTDKQEYWRWTDWGEQLSAGDQLNTGAAASLLTEDMYVQPNFEIILPENAVPALRWQIETFAELKTADVAMIYELTRDSVCRAVECGWQAGQIVACLDRFSKMPVPDNVKAMVTSWTGHLGQTKIWDVCVFEIKSAALAAQLRSQRPIAALIAGTFSDRAWIVRRDHQEKLRNLLQKAGYPPMRKIFSPENARERRKAERVPAVFDDNRQTLAPDWLPDEALDRSKVAAAVWRPLDGSDVNVWQLNDFNY
ncbi:MAG: helicase-associated domain-containing protein [Sporolactobacillus sp.]